jgi:hypothetical protein
MTTQIQTFGVHRIVIKPIKHLYPTPARSVNDFTVLSLELYNIKGERIPTNISLYSAGEQSEVSFAPTETIEHT